MTAAVGRSGDVGAHAGPGTYEAGTYSSGTYSSENHEREYAAGRHSTGEPRHEPYAEPYAEPLHDPHHEPHPEPHHEPHPDDHDTVRALGSAAPVSPAYPAYPVSPAYPPSSGPTGPTGPPYPPAVEPGYAAGPPGEFAGAAESPEAPEPADGKSKHRMIPQDEVVVLRPVRTHKGYRSVYAELTRTTVGSVIRTSVRTTGELLITGGLVVLFFATYAIWGKAAITNAAQQDLNQAIEKEWEVGLDTVEPEILQFFVRQAVAFYVIDSCEGDSARGDYGGSLPGVVRPLLKWNTELSPDAAVQKR